MTDKKPSPPRHPAPQISWTARLYALAERELSKAATVKAAAEALARRTGIAITSEALEKGFSRRVRRGDPGCLHASRYLPQNACVPSSGDTVAPGRVRHFAGSIADDTIAVPAPEVPPAVAAEDAEREEKRSAEVGAAEQEYLVTMPVGHRVKGNSTLLDENDDPIKRWVKTEKEPLDPPAFAPVPEGFAVSKVSTLLDATQRVSQQWVSVDKPREQQFEEMKRAMERAVLPYKGLATPEVYTRAANATNDLLTTYIVGDAHIGMLAWARETGEDFDLRIAETEIGRALDLLVTAAPESEQATFLNVGDWFHVQGNEQRTPRSGVKLDADSRFGKIAEVGFRVARAGVTKLLSKHDRVNVVSVPGNHDPELARMLALWLKAVFENEPRVTVQDNAAPYMYERFGKNLIGYFHGDGAKLDQLPAIMAADRPGDWGATIYRTWYGGHVHHKITKEHPGCTVETFQTLAGKDAWHTHMGYRALQSMTAITLDREFGEITRSKADIRLVRARLSPKQVARFGGESK